MQREDLSESCQLRTRADAANRVIGRWNYSQSPIGAQQDRLRNRKPKRRIALHQRDLSATSRCACQIEGRMEAPSINVRLHPAAPFVEPERRGQYFLRVGDASRLPFADHRLT